MDGQISRAYWEMALNMAEGKGWRNNSRPLTVNKPSGKKEESNRFVQEWLKKLDEEEEARARGEIPARVPDYVFQYGNVEEENLKVHWSCYDDYDNSEDDDDNEQDDCEPKDHVTDYEGEADDEEGIVKVPVGYIDIAPFFQPIHVWEEYYGPIEGEDYYHGGVEYHHRERTPEEQAIYEAEFAAEMAQMFGDRGYESDFASDLVEKEEEEENLGQRMTDPEDEDTDYEADQRLDGRREEERNGEEDEVEDWDVTNPLPVRID